MQPLLLPWMGRRKNNRKEQNMTDNGHFRFLCFFYAII